MRRGDVVDEGTALLETDHLLFRGKSRVKIAFADVRAVEVVGTELRLTTAADGEIAFDLGRNASRWATRIRTPPGRLEKLGVKEGQRVALVELDDAEFIAEISARAGDVTHGKPRGKGAL